MIADIIAICNPDWLLMRCCRCLRFVMDSDIFAKISYLESVFTIQSRRMSEASAGIRAFRLAVQILVQPYLRLCS